MYKAVMKEQLSNIDQENLELNIKNWVKERPAEKFFFRPYIEKDDNKEPEPGADDIKINLGNNGLLFIHQV